MLQQGKGDQTRRRTTIYLRNEEEERNPPTFMRDSSI